MKRFSWLVTGAVVLCLAIALLVGCGVSQSEYEALQADYQASQAELQTAQSDLASLQADYDALNTDYQAASAELAQIQEVYPPKHFATYDELEEWVEEHHSLAQGTGVHEQHLDLQQMALADGYIWSVAHCYFGGDDFGVHGVALTEDSIYWVWLSGNIEWEEPR
jgi:outer membrane murein-binding lipoprotein Lpp